ncbi:MAG: hypothetical protein AAB112_06165, partial [Thermodesulfobacteriota bacterium]
TGLMSAMHYYYKAVNVLIDYYAILTQVMERGKPLQMDELRLAPWHEALYANLGDKTKQRDLSSLREQELLYVDEKGLVWPGFAREK